MTNPTTLSTVSTAASSDTSIPHDAESQTAGNSTNTPKTAKTGFFSRLTTWIKNLFSSKIDDQTKTGFLASFLTTVRHYNPFASTEVKQIASPNPHQVDSSAMKALRVTLGDGSIPVTSITTDSNGIPQVNIFPPSSQGMSASEVQDINNNTTPAAKINKLQISPQFTKELTAALKNPNEKAIEESVNLDLNDENPHALLSDALSIDGKESTPASSINNNINSHEDSEYDEDDQDYNGYNNGYNNEDENGLDEHVNQLSQYELHRS